MTAPRGGHPYHMHDAIYAQPGALRLVARLSPDALAAAAARLRGTERVVLAGTGTSWHAALVGALLFAHAGRFGLRARALGAIELSTYWPAAGATTGVVLVSHRGRHRVSREVFARTGGVRVAVTGKGAEPVEGADHTVWTVPLEASGAHTVGYTCAVAALATLAAATAGDDDTQHALDAIPDQMALLLGSESWDEVAERFADRRRYWFVGGGPNAATAYEAALKLSETGHVIATGVECEEFLHGPWAAVTGDDAVFVVAPPGPSYERCVTAARVAAEVGAAVVAIVQEGDRDLSAIASYTIEMAAVSEWLSPILAIVPLQLFAYHMAVRRGLDPDAARPDDPPHRRASALLSP